MNKTVIPTIFGVLNLIWGALGVLGGLASVSMLFLFGVIGNSNLAVKLVDESVLLKVVSYSGIMIGLFASFALFAAGVGLLLGSAWGRRWSLAVSWCDLAVSLMYIMVYVPLFWLPYLKAIDAMEPSREQTTEWVGWWFSVGSVPVTWIYPLATLFFLNRQRVIDALEGREVVHLATPRMETGNPYQSP